MNGNLVGVNPLLASPGNYGGPTQTMPLLPGSPAIDAGDTALAVDAQGNRLTTDQRGMPRVVGAAVHIGAFESSGFTLAIADGNNQSTPANTDFPTALQVSVTPKNPGDPVQRGRCDLHPARQRGLGDAESVGARDDRLGYGLGHGDGQRHRGRPVRRHGRNHRGLVGSVLPQQ